MVSKNFSSAHCQSISAEGIDPTCLYFMKEDNCFIDEGGYVVLNPFDYINPNDLLLFKRRKTTYGIVNRKGEPVALFYPEEDEA